MPRPLRDVKGNKGVAVDGPCIYGVESVGEPPLEVGQGIRDN